MANRFLNNITVNDSYTLPSSDGDADQIIVTDGAGNLSFVDTTTISVGESEQVHIACKNTSGVAISKGDPVYITGTVGTSFRVEVAAADASNSAKMPAVGLAESDLAINAEGYIIVSGVLKNLTTDPLSTGDGTPSSNDTVYVKAGGGLTRTKPTGSGNLIQNVGKVGRVNSANAGSIAVSTIMRTNDVPNLTTGKIWVGSSTYTTESTVVHLDETNGRMGIGMTNPLRKLDISANANDGIRLAANNALIGGGAAGGDTQLLYWNGSTAYYGRGSLGGSVTQHEFRTSGTTRMLINSSGNVLVNKTSSTGDIFQVQGNNNVYSLRLDGSSTVGQSYGLRVRAGTSSADKSMLVENTSGTDLFLVRGDGNVGIGTDSPSALLEISKDSDDGTNAPNFRLTNASDTLSDGAVVGIIEFNNEDNSGGDRHIATIKGIANSIDERSVELAFSPAVVGTTNEAMRIDKDGNVGIGTTSPLVKLDVNGVLYSRGGTWNGGGSENNYTIVGAVIQEGHFIFTKDGDNLRKLIGKTSDIIEIGQAGTSLIDGISFLSGTTPLYRWYNNSSEIMRLNATGLGVGETNPSAKLHVIGSSTSTDLAMRIANNANTQLLQVRNDGFVAINHSNFDYTLDVQKFANENDDTIINIRSNWANTSANKKIGSLFFTAYDVDVDSGATKTAGGIRVHAENEWTSAANANAYMTFNTLGGGLFEERMRITSDGSVGIGTTNPGVINGVSFASVGLHTNFSTLGRTITEGSNWAEYILNDSGTSINQRAKYVRSDNGTLSFGSYDDNGTSRNHISILNDGNVGIGTTSPGAKLDIAGKQIIRNGTTAAQSTDYLYIGGDGLGSANAAIYLGNSGDGGGYGWRLFYQGTGSGNNNKLHFRSENLGSQVDAISLKQDGDIQFGAYGSGTFTGTATQRLAVDSSGNVIEIPIGSGPVDGSGTANYVTKWSDTDTITDSIIYDNGTNVGIGTLSPGAKLDVNGVSRISGTFAETGQDPLLEFYNTDTSLGANQILGTIDFYQSDPSGGGVGVVSRIRSINDSGFKGEASLTFHTGEANVSFQEHMRINSSGNVGIGTSSPGEKLTVHSTATAIQTLYTTNTQGGFTGYHNSTGGVKGFVGYGPTLFLGLDLNDFGLRSQSGMAFSTNGAYVRMYITSAGNVGIGTTNPGYKLDVESGNIRVSSAASGEKSFTFYEESGGPTGATMGYDGTTNNLFLGTTSDNNSTIAQHLVIPRASGNVGIGTTNPTTKLYVDAGESTFNRGNSDGAIARFRGKNAEKAVIGTVDSWFSSNVGIGVTSPSAKLDVAGTLKATGEVTLSNYSDGGLSVNSSGVVRVEPSYQNISLGESYAANLREYYYRNGYTVSPTDTGYQYAKLIDQSLLNKASLVLIPQAQKEGLLAANKPNGTNFTFSRTSAATRVNSEGLIEKETQNLLLQSNNFNTSPWGSYDGLTGGQTGYDGSSDAWLLTYATSPAIVSQANTSSGVQTYSVYAKGNVNNGLRLYAFGSSNCYGFFDLNTGSVEVTQNLIDATIEDKGNGWYRCAITFNQTNSQLYMYLSNNANANATSGSIYIQDAQLNQGLVADSYLETTTTAVYGGITDNIPRLDYTDASCPSLLLEPQRTNVVINNEYPTGLAQNVTLEPALSPEGRNNALKISETTNTGQHYVAFKSSVVNGTTYVLSFFIKEGTYPTIVFYTQTSKMSFNISYSFSTNNITIGGADAIANSEMVEDYGNGWKRLSARATAHANGEMDLYCCVKDLSSYTGDTANHTYYYGFQIEEGNYLTSLIPTYGASVTRVEDAYSKTGISDLIGQTEGTLFVEINISHLDGTAARDLFFLSNTNNISDDWVGIGFSGVGSNAFRARISDGGVIKFDQYGTISSTATYKIALAYKSGDSEFYINGGSFGTNYANTSFSLTLDRIFDAPNFTFGDSIKQILLFKTRLTNAELAELTTL